MRAAFAVAGPGRGTIEIRDIEAPRPVAGQIQVRVAAAAANRAEVWARYTLPEPRRLGIEISGYVTELGEGVSELSVGDRIMARCSGAYSEYVTLPAAAAMLVPGNLTNEEAASIPNVFVTAHDAIVTNANLKKGEAVLINAASSGIGIAAIQIAKLLGAQPIIATSSSDAKLDRLKPLGIDVGINTKSDWVSGVRRVTNGTGVNVVIDSVGGTVLDQNLHSMTIGGRLVSVGRLASKQGDLNLDLLALKRLHLIGVTFRTRNESEALECSTRFANHLLPAFASGELKPIVDRIFLLEQLDEAHEYMERDTHIGKIVIKVQS